MGLYNLDNSLIEEIDSNCLNQTAKRPSLGGLKIDKIQDQFYEKIIYNIWVKLWMNDVESKLLDLIDVKNKDIKEAIDDVLAGDVF